MSCFFPQALQPEGSYFLPLHLDLFCSAKGLKKVVLSHSPSFSYQFHGKDWNDEISTWLLRYIEKKPCKRGFTFDDDGLSTFQKHILFKLESVSFGTTCSYAELNGRPFARAAGTVCKMNPWPLFIGCHRVITSSGELGGFAFGKDLKRLLLEFERVNPSAS